MLDRLPRDGEPWERWASLEALASSDDGPTRTATESARRAVKRLAAEGVVELDAWCWIDRRAVEGRPARRMLYARRALTLEETAAEARHRKAEERRMERAAKRFRSRAGLDP